MVRPRVVIVLAACLIGLTLVGWWVRKPKDAHPPSGLESAQPAPETTRPLQLRSAANPSTTNMMDDDRARLFDPRPDVTPVEMDVFLSRKGRTAGNLIAAWQLTTNLPFLEDAAGRFPDDPTVQFAVLQSGLYPEQRRQWLDRFKASAPNNALASLLS